MPKISVLMTVYNDQRFIKESIKSVLSQSFKDFEFIIIDDGSTDKTKQIINSFKDKRIKYFYYGENKGINNLHNVINFGLEKCKGKYISRLDSDDLFYKNKLEIQYNYLEKHSKIFMIGGSADVINKYGNVINQMNKRSYPPFIHNLLIGIGNSFIHSTIMFRNEGLKYPFMPEHFFYLNLLYNKKKIKNLKTKLIQYRINHNGIMSKHRDIKNNKYKEIYNDRQN